MTIEILEKISSKYDPMKIIYQLNNNDYLVETRHEIFGCTIHELHKHIKSEKKKLTKKVRNKIIYEKLCDGVWVSTCNNNIWKRIFSSSIGYKITEIFYKGVITKTIDIKYKNDIIDLNGSKLSIKLPIFNTWALIFKNKDTNLYSFQKQAFFEYNKNKFFIPYGNQSNFVFCTPAQSKSDLSDSDVYFDLFQTVFSNHGTTNFSIPTKSENIIITNKLIEWFNNPDEFIVYFNDKFKNIYEKIERDPSLILNTNINKDMFMSKIEILYYIALQIKKNNVEECIKCFKPVNTHYTPFEGI